MADPTQDNRLIQLVTPLGKDKLLLQSFSGQEGVSIPFHYDLSMLSLDKSIKFEDIVGQPATIKVVLPDDKERFIDGIFNSFTQCGIAGEFASYQATLVPRLWMLTRNADCRIFQDQSALEIIQAILKENGVNNTGDGRLTAGRYQKREYCVQYSETDFHFVSRLMEEEGIYYFFTHDSSSHTMVLTDDAKNWTTCTDLTAANYGGSPADWEDDSLLTGFSIEQTLTTGQVKLDDFSFLTPATSLLATASGTDTTRSVYDYPGLYAVQSDGDTKSTLRLDSLDIEQNRITGTSLCRAFQAGAKFTVAGHYRSDANASYVLRRVSLQVTQERYSNSFEAFPATAVFRPPMVTRKPLIPGTQTAMVVGKQGEEIWTD